MLLTFHSKASANITMFGDVALALLRMMGHSGTVPGALLAADIPAALARLRQGLASAGQATDNGHSISPSAKDAPDSPPPISIGLRAYPLIQLLSTAARQGCDVMWNDDHPAA